MIRAVLMLAPLLAPAAALAAAPPAAQVAQPAPLSLEHRMLVRCSAAFALVSHRQALGEEWALAYPALNQRGREFFVRASAQVIDEARMDRTQVAGVLAAEAQSLGEVERIREIMPACLAALDATGL